MLGLRYRLKTDWLFYLFIAAYAYSIMAMTIRLWFGDGVNVFASYSDASVPAEVIVEANKVYWSKTWFLFGSLLLMGFNVDIRAAFGSAAIFWAGSLMLIFSIATPNLIFILVVGVALVIQQIVRKGFFAPPGEKA
ncbi:MAG: hypothetical protein AAF269_01970 [Pseudomonadota bacterium]